MMHMDFEWKFGQGMAGQEIMSDLRYLSDIQVEM